ncbi:MAG: protease modulator HflC [Pedosphaera sp.]|nr:protease modulator HflC [Pedosphaera sp.]
MKNRIPTLIIGSLLLLIFLFLLFAFQVRTTEVAVVTTFGSISGQPRTEPGLYPRFPYPIQTVYKFDKRLQNFERKYEQSFTRDKKSPIISVFVAWQIEEPIVFLKRFNGDVARAEASLENVVRDAKNAVIGRHDFSELIAPNPSLVKFDEIETEMKIMMSETALKTYGIKIELVGIKQLGLPEGLTAKVFDRMKTERERQVKKLIAEGTSEAVRIRSDAELKRDTTLAEARRQALVLRGEAEAKATEFYKILNQDETLARFLISLNGLEATLKDRTTLILDEKTAPLNLLRGDIQAPVNR